MEDKLLNKEISQENPGVSSDLRHTTNSLQNTTFDLFKTHARNHNMKSSAISSH